MKTAFNRIFRESRFQETFEQDGYAIVDFLTQDEVASLLQLWEGLDDDVKSQPFSATVMSPNLSYRRRVSEAIQRTFAERLGAVLNNYRFCHAAFIAKLPGMDEGHVLLHQDQSFVDEDRFTPAIVWVPLSDVTRDTGCLRVVRGSHRINHGPRGTYRDFPYPDLRPEIETRFLTDIPMRAGQACITTSTLFHESRVHHGNRPRVVACALTIPEESRLLYCYQETMDAAARMEVFEVPDDFYLRHTFGVRPAGLESVGFVEAQTEPVTLTQFEAVCIPAPLGS